MYGPLDYVAIGFPGNRFTGEILPAMQEIVDAGVVRIVDLAFVSKGEDGAVTIMELEDLGADQVSLFSPLVGERSGLVSRGDLEAIGSLLDNNSSAAFILWENTWATKFAQAVLRANGMVLARETVPYELVDAALNQSPTAPAGAS